mmetsp:Transcript_11539/g.23220  ORF Transcript_11539/g.23220 Transcript_11539/m.23220 type:complete len:172 (-) Transcript_11539:438-953(-)
MFTFDDMCNIRRTFNEEMFEIAVAFKNDKIYTMRLTTQTDAENLGKVLNKALKKSLPETWQRQQQPIENNNQVDPSQSADDSGEQRAQPTWPEAKVRSSLVRRATLRRASVEVVPRRRSIEVNADSKGTNVERAHNNKGDGCGDGLSLDPKDPGHDGPVFPGLTTPADLVA